MKTILLTIIATIIFLNVNAVTTYTVISNADPDSYVYRYDFDDAKCDPVMYGTLQWAIRKVLDTPGECRIEFNIPGTSPVIILLNYTLPTLEKKIITIDATTQPGYSQGNPQIILDGNLKLLTGLYFNNLKNSGVKGIVFKHFVSQAVMFNYANSFNISDCYFVENGSVNSKVFPASLRIVSSTNGTVKGNYLGIDPYSGNPIGNSAYGLVLSDNSNSNTIGGINPGESNTIINNQKFGIWVTNKSWYNKISGNIIYGSDRAIILEPDGNQLKHEPIISDYNNNSYLLKGGADPYDVVEIFGSNGNQSANEYITTVQADYNGKWEVIATTNYSNYVATATDQLKNTSILSNPFHAPNALSRLINTDCDISEVLFSQVLTTEAVYRAEMYEFMITDDNSGISENIVKNTNTFSLNELIMPIQLNTAYRISVRVKIGELWGQYGEICKIKTVKSTTIQACIDEELNFTINGVHINDPIQITMTYPTGVTGLNNASIPAYPSTSILVDISNPLMPQYSFNAPDTSFTLNYHIKVGCENFSPTTQNILYSINQNGIVTTDSFSVNFPVIVFDPNASINIQYGNAHLGTAFERTFHYKNTSSYGIFSGVIEFRDTIQIPSSQTVIRVDSVWVIAPTSGTIDILKTEITDSTVIHRVKVDNIDFLDSIVFHELVFLDGCPNSYNNVTYFDAKYGCDSTKLCVQINGSYTKANFDPNDKPALSYVILTPGYQTCWSDSLERVMRIVNTGGGSAPSVYIGIINGNSLSLNITDHPLYDFEVYKIVSGNEIPIPFIATTPLFSNNQAILTTDTLFPNDTIYLRYYEKINCIDSSNYNTYFNHATRMHWEGFPYIVLNHPCYSTPYKHYPDGNGYYNATWRRNFSLNQVFNNLNGTISACDSAWFDVSSNSLQLGNQWGGFIFDGDSAEIVIELDLEPGLGLVDSSLYISSVYNNVVSNLYADSFEFLPGPNNFAGGNKIIARFSIPDTLYSEYLGHNHGFIDKPEIPDFNNFFNDFKVNFHLYSDCNFATNTPTTITEKVFFNPNKNCTNQCMIPLSKVEDDIFILCPGCLLPGWNIGEFDIKRTNFGSEDTNNNNYPDSYPLQPVDPNIAQNQHIILGDTINCHLHAVVSDGTANLAHFDCTLSIADSTDTLIFNFANIGFPFTNAQAVFKGDILDKLSFIGGDGTFNDADNGLFSFIIPALSNTIVQSGAFALDIGIPAMQSYGVPNTVDSINAGDVFDLNIKFRVVQNLVFSGGLNPLYNIKGIDAMLNMSGIPYTGIDIMPDAANYLEPDFLAMTPQERSELNYWCTGNQGNVVAIGTNFYSATAPFAWGEGHKDSTNTTVDITNYNPCYYTLGYNARTDVGRTLSTYNWEYQTPATPLEWNSFSFEIRNLWMLDSLKFSFPDIFEIDRIDIKATQLWDIDTSQNNILTNFNCFMFWNVGTFISNDDLYNYDLSGSTDAIITDSTLTIFPSAHFSQITGFQGCDNFLTAYDETKRYRVEARLKMKDYHLTPNNTTSPEYARVNWSSFPGAFSGDTAIINTYNLVYSKPIATLQTQTLLQQQNYMNNDLVWNMIVNTIGTQVWQNGLINNRAENTFIYFESPNNNIFIDSLIWTNNNTHVPVVNSIGGNNLYGLGTIGTQWGWLDSAHVSVYANYDCSHVGNTDTLVAIYGWNCYGYPDTLENACFLDTTYLIFDILQTGYQADISTNDTINVCDTATYDIKITATGVGTVENIQVNMAESLNNEYNYVPGSAYLQYNGSTEFLNPINIQTDSLSWVLDSASIFHNFETDTLHLIFNIVGNCGFGNNEIGFTITAENYCNKPLQTIQWSGVPVVTGFPVQDSLLVSINMTDSVSGCGDSTLVNLTITNTGNNNTSALNTLQVILPNSYMWSSGDIPSSVAGQTYTYNLAGNVTPAGSQTIQFYIAGNSGGGIYNIIANAYVTQAFPCNNDTCIFTQSQIETSDTVQFNIVPLNATVNIVNPTCNGLCNGTASAVCTGIAPFTYAWNTGATTPAITGLCTGNYSLIVTDANGCKDTVLFIISNPAPFVVNINSNSGNPCSTACTGSTTVQLSGGTAPFIYNWNTGDTTISINNLCPDTFFVTVTDFNGCVATASVTLVNNLISPPVASISILNPDTNCLVAGTPVNFTSPNQAGVTYSWYYGDGATGNVYNPSYPYSDYGYYCVILTTSNQCGAASAHTTIFIQPQNCNCNTTYTFADGTVIGSLNNHWNQANYGSTITVQGLVTIPLGQTLVIDDNVVVQFAPKGRIIVQRGGKLRVHSVTLTSINSCSMWQGIEVWGDGNRVSTHPVQGNVEIRSSTIENAHLAVLLGRRKSVSCSNIDDANPFDNHFSGGTVYSVMSTYKNDGVGIKFIWKSNPDGVFNRIDSNTFICTPALVDGNYLNTSPNRYPNSQNPWAGQANANSRTDIGIQANHIKWLKIKGCVFDNTDYGIFTIDDQRSVVLNCRFKNHRQGMHIENIMPTFLNSYDISMCTFDYIPGNTIGALGQNDGTALYISGSRGDRIHDGNQFNNTYSTTIPSYGIRTNNASSFEITNNIFFKLTTGAIIQNSIPFNGNVMAKASSNGSYSWSGNWFTLCKTGITTKNDNSYLCLRCNTHNNFTSNFLININTESGTLANQGYNGWQVYTNSITKSRFGAGNRFVNSNLNKLGSVFGYNYYFQDSTLSPNYNPKVLVTPISKYQIDTVPFYTISQSCPFPNFLPPDINLPISLNTPVFQRIDSLNNVALTIESQYIALLNNADKGHTYELLNAIYSNPPTGQLKNMLIADSPLSDTVLTALNIQNPLSIGNYKNVMEENLPVTKNVVSSFNSRVETLPPGIKNQLKEKQVNNPGKITLGYLETKLSQAILTKQLYFNEIISLLLDTLNNRNADAITLFEREATPAANMTLAANYISDSNYSAALSKLAMLPNDDSQIGEWKTYATFLLNHLTQGKTLEELDSNQIDYLRTLANQCPEGIATVNAKAILMYLYREEVPACPENGMRTMRVENNNIHQTNLSYLGDNYPDPFSRNTVIPYNLPEGSKGIIEIKDVTGRIILTLSLQEGENTLEIDSKGWANGIYFYGMKINNENIENKKMVKTN
ncbi:MAG: PKD domain-containing protein [Bacteroidia bacterium]|nr:PKD domain-containing protein [Bacteroidia bacterium]